MKISLRSLFKDKPKKIVVIIFVLVMFFVLPIFVFAAGQLDKDSMFGGERTGGASVINEEMGGLTEDDPRIIIARIINIIFGFLGIIMVILIMYAGWLWMNSQGDSGKIEKAKERIKAAVIGLAIILASFAIVNFILSIWFDTMPSPQSTPPQGREIVGGIGAMGAGIIQSVYPAPGQGDIPRNTVIIVTFREEITASDIYDGGNNVNMAGVKIFTEGNQDACLNDNECIDATVSTVDHKTFVFVPKEYLTSEDWQHVYITENVTKADGTAAFEFGDGYEWAFETSDGIDLIPPKVLNLGVYPGGDNMADSYSMTDATWAEGSIEVTDNSALFGSVDMKLTSPEAITPDTPSASVDGAYSCEDADITVSVGSGGLSIRASGDPGLLPGDLELNNNEASIGCGLTFSIFGSATIGNGWTFHATPAQSASTLTIGSSVYEFGKDINIGTDNDSTARNIESALASDAEVEVLQGDGPTVNLKAKIGGTRGNSILLLGNPSASFNINPMSGGSDASERASSLSRKDKPKNVVVQINFNEAIMPIKVSGSSADVEGTIRAEARPNDGSGDWKTIEGEFKVSNQYRTIEFISNEECGMNGCGDKIYCLPGKSEIRVSFKAFPLETCSSSAGCSSKSPFTSCGESGNVSVCQSGSGVSIKNFPGIDYEDLAFTDGITDTALNSLDGNRNNNAEGPSGQSGTAAFDENELISSCSSDATSPGYAGKICNFHNQVESCGRDNVCFYDSDASQVKDSNLRNAELQTERGDDFTWEFFTSDEVQIEPPVISQSNPSQSDVSVALDAKINLLFDSVMMSGTLSTGEYLVYNNAETIVHKLINIWDIVGRPLAYWITKENIDEDSDGEADKTNTFINHSLFTNSTTFRTQIGSGTKDIYQNCFKPSSGPGCVNVSDIMPSCCFGAATSGASCD